MTGGGRAEGSGWPRGRCRQSPPGTSECGPDRRNQDDAHWAAVSKLRISEASLRPSPGGPARRRFTISRLCDFRGRWRRMLQRQRSSFVIAELTCEMSEDPHLLRPRLPGKRGGSTTPVSLSLKPLRGAAKGGRMGPPLRSRTKPSSAAGGARIAKKAAHGRRVGLWLRPREQELQMIFSMGLLEQRTH
jgi:hypothetical protein